MNWLTREGPLYVQQCDKKPTLMEKYIHFEFNHHQYIKIGSIRTLNTLIRYYQYQILPFKLIGKVWLRKLSISLTILLKIAIIVIIKKILSIKLHLGRTNILLLEVKVNVVILYVHGILEKNRRITVKYGVGTAILLP